MRDRGSANQNATKDKGPREPREPRDHGKQTEAKGTCMMHDDPQPRHHGATKGPREPRDHGTTATLAPQGTTGTTGPRGHSNHMTKRRVVPQAPSFVPLTGIFFLPVREWPNKFLAAHKKNFYNNHNHKNKEAPRIVFIRISGWSKCEIAEVPTKPPLKTKDHGNHGTTASKPRPREHA